MTDQPQPSLDDLPPELLEWVAETIKLCRKNAHSYRVKELAKQGLWPESNWWPSEEVIARAVAPMLIAHGRELEKAAMAANPVTADFMLGVPAEAAHQRERWGVNHDAGKTPFDWFWLVGYLAQKAAQSAVDGNTEKALHHTISTAAALANWHAALTGKSTSMRPGIEPPNEHRSKP